MIHLFWGKIIVLVIHHWVESQHIFLGRCQILMQQLLCVFVLFCFFVQDKFPRGDLLFFFFLKNFTLFIFWLCWVFVSVWGLSLVAASGGYSSSRRAGLSLSQPLAAEHRLQTRRLSSRGSRAQPLHGMWDPPRPGLEPLSPALTGRLSTTAPPGKPRLAFYILMCFKLHIILGKGIVMLSSAADPQQWNWIPLNRFKMFKLRAVGSGQRG